MFAIAFLFFILLYLFISYLLALGISKLFSVKGIKKQTTKNIVFGFMVALVMWDWIPMELSYQYKCSNEAGFTIHKTLEQWQRENPSVWETLSARALPEEYLVKEHMYEKSGVYEEHGERYYQLPDGTQLEASFNIHGDTYVDIIRSDGSRAYWLNQRFASDKIITQYWFHINKQEERIIDTQTNEILARRIDFGTNILPLGLGKELKDYKFWMQKNSCWKKENKNKWLVNGYAFSQLKSKLRNIDGERK